MSKITSYSSFGAVDTANDVLIGVDVSDTSMAATGTDKKITVGNLLAAAARTAFTVPAPTGVAATDSANIRAALTAASSAGGGTVFLQNGTYIGDTSAFAIPVNTILYFQADTILQVNCSGGSSVDAITIANHAAILGEGQGGANVAQIAGTSTINCRTLISNATHATQEFCYITGLNVTCNGGGTYAVAVVEMVSCFVNSGIRDCVIDGAHNNAGVPLLRIAGSATDGFGPVFVQDTWLLNSGGDGLVITENNPSAGACQFWADNLTVEHPSDGFHNVRITGFGGLVAAKFRGLHTENNTATTTGPVAGVKIDGAHCVTISDYMLMSGANANKVGVWITSADNQQVHIDNLKNVNGISPVIKDDNSGVNFGGSGNVYQYHGPTGTVTQLGSVALGGDFRLAAQSVALASTAVNARNGPIVDVAALAANVTVAAPSSPGANEILIFRFVQDATGGRTVSWDPAFRVAAGVVSTTASKASMVGFRYDSSLSAWVQMFATTGV